MPRVHACRACGSPDQPLEPLVGGWLEGGKRLGKRSRTEKNMWQTKKNVPPSKKWLLLKEDFLGEEIKVFLLIV